MYIRSITLLEIGRCSALFTNRGAHIHPAGEALKQPPVETRPRIGRPRNGAGNSVSPGTSDFRGNSFRESPPPEDRFPRSVLDRNSPTRKPEKPQPKPIPIQTKTGPWCQADGQSVFEIWHSWSTPKARPSCRASELRRRRRPKPR